MSALVIGLAVAGCASRPVPLAMTPPAVAAVAEAAPLPPGATPGMVIPTVLADGRYPTPNQGLSDAAALWHLRAGLNVAALSCPGAQGAAIVSGYNAMLTRQRAALAAADTRYTAEFRVETPTAWRGRYDEAMTRLYNFYSLTPARTSLCDAASAVLAADADVDGATLATRARDQVAMLDRPFTDFYRAYDAWRAGGQVIAQAAPAPHLNVDVASLADDRVTLPR